MKKLCHRVSIFLAFLLLLTIVVGIAATAHAVTCVHDLYTTGLTSEYDEVSSTQHSCIEYTMTYCRKCDYSKKTIIKSGYESHSYSLYDMGHNPNHTHTYRSSCNKCDRIQSEYDIVCEGPPCIAPYSLEATPELQ